MRRAPIVLFVASLFTLSNLQTVCGSATGLWKTESNRVAMQTGLNRTPPASGKIGQSDRVSMLSQGYGRARTNANLAETTLNTSNVNAGQFGKLFTRQVDGSIYAQPLVMTDVSIAGAGAHDVVFLATEHNSVYAYDADDPNASAPLWHVNFGASVPSTDINPNYRDLTPEIGITSTPVIDPDSGTIYVVSKTKDSAGYHQRIHALDIGSGAEKFNGPMEITASIAGTGLDSASGRVTFNTLLQLNRPGLLLLNGRLYIGFGSQGDYGVWHGWLMAYDATSLRQVAVFCSTPDGREGGIWGAGHGVTADDDGNLYVATGNGLYDVKNGTGRDFGDSVVKLSPSLSVLDWFTPDTQASLDTNDEDLGSGGPLLLPGTNSLVICGKDGILRLIDTGTMGKFNPSANNDSQEFQATSATFLGRPAYWESPNNGPVIFMWGAGDFLKEYQFAGGRFQNQPVSKSTVQVASGWSNAVPLTVSSNGSQPGTGIVWASAPDGADSNRHVVHGVLHAFDATDLTRELWNSGQNPGRDDTGNYAKFCPPTVANGMVYEASFSGVLSVYGLLPQSPAGQCGATIDSFSGEFGTPGGDGRINVRGQSGCAWQAVSNSSWITITSGSGRGDGSVQYGVELNEGPARSGSITVAGQNFAVSQTSGCWSSVDSGRQTFSADGGSGSVALTASESDCPWTATTNASWLTITGPASGTGSATIAFTVAPNTKKKRTAVLTVGSQTVTIMEFRP